MVFINERDTMRIIIVAISLTLLPLLIGCVTYEPVAAMPNWKLQSEYDDLQIKQRQWEREMMYGGLEYSTYQAGNITNTSSSNPAIGKLNNIENRMREIQSEILRRQQMGYQTAAPHHSPATKPRSGPVYSTKYSRIFHRSECSKLKSKDADLMTFPSNESAMNNGGKPCPECNP